MAEKTTGKKKEKVKWGTIGAPDSKKRKEYLAGIRAKKRVTKKSKEEAETARAKDEIAVIESPTMDIGLEEKTREDPAPVVRDLQIKETKKQVISPEVDDYMAYPY